MIRAVLFDLYETLVTEREASPSRASSLAGELGVDAKAYRSVWKRLRPRVVRGELSFAQALIDAGAELGVSVDPAVVETIRVRRVREKAVVFRQVRSDLVALVQQLDEQGLRLGVVSNGFAEDVAGWSDCVLSPRFDATVFSCELGIAKPDPSMYVEGIKRLGVDAPDALYIGDGGDDELTGAEQAGLRAMRAAWFTGALATDSRERTWPVLTACDDVLQLAGARQQDGY